MTADQIQTYLDEVLDAVLSSGRNTARPAEQLALCNAAQQAFVLHWLEVIVRTNSELGFQFVVNVPRALTFMTSRGFTRAARHLRPSITFWKSRVKTSVRLASMTPQPPY